MFDYCRRCRKFLDLNRNYCRRCNNLIGRNKKTQAFNKWRSSEVFIECSFEDCIDDTIWGGFQDIKYDPKIVEQIDNRFEAVKYIKSFYRSDKDKVDDGNILYLVSDANLELLKVGQTYNYKNRLSRYNTLFKNTPLRFDIFSVKTFPEMNLYEAKIRNYLEYLGYLLPQDNSGLRLKYILNKGN
jgi:hypothetical protein